MNDEDRKELVRRVVDELKHEHHIIRKDDWRALLIRTLVSMFLVGGATVLGVLAVVYGSAQVASLRYMRQLENQAEQHLEDMKGSIDFSDGQVAIKGNVQIVGALATEGGVSVPKLRVDREVRVGQGEGVHISEKEGIQVGYGGYTAAGGYDQKEYTFGTGAPSSD